MLHTLQHEYDVDCHMLEIIKRMYINTFGQVAGGQERFSTTIRVRQGCPMSPLLFALFFDRVVKYIQTHTQGCNAIKVASLAI